MYDSEVYLKNGFVLQDGDWEMLGKTCASQRGKQHVFIMFSLVFLFCKLQEEFSTNMILQVPRLLSDHKELITAEDVNLGSPLSHLI